MEFTILFPFAIMSLFISLVNSKFLVFFLIFYLTLQISSIINIHSIGYSLQFYRFFTIVISIYFVLRLFKYGFKIPLLVRHDACLIFVGIFFGTYATIVSLMLPHIFEGIDVFPPQLGIDYSAQYGASPLQFSMYNIAFPIFIVFYLITFVHILTLKWEHKDINLVLISFYLSVVLSLFTSFSQIMSSIVGTDFTRYLYTIITREYSLSIIPFLGIPRIQGTFQEPSMFAPFIVGLYSISLSKYLENYKTMNLIAVLFFLIISLLSASTTAILSLALLTAIIVIYHLFYVKNITPLRFLIFLIIASTFVFIAFKNPVINTILQISVFEKHLSASYINRIYSDIFALNLFIETYGMGCGLGCNRSSSLLPNLLSQLGLIGTLAFFVFIFKIIKRSFVLVQTTHESYIFLLPSSIIVQLIAYPDITNPTLWQYIYIITILSNYHIAKSQRGVVCPK